MFHVNSLPGFCIKHNCNKPIILLIYFLHVMNIRLYLVFTMVYNFELQGFWT
jgi:hypothetical protein